MNFIKALAAAAVSFFILSSTGVNAATKTVTLSSGTCWSYGCSAPSRSCSASGGSFTGTSDYRGAFNYRCVKTVTVQPPKTTSVISSGLCYSYGCSQPSQYCRSQGGTFTGTPSRGGFAYVCRR